jgi:hypothetical protein
MHRTEHCNHERRAPAFPLPDFRFRGYRIKASTRAATSPGRGRMLATAFHSPATAAVFTASISGSTFLACHFASLPIDSIARSIFGSATDPVCPAIGRLNALDPLQLPRPTRFAASPASTPLRDCYIPPDQSVQPDQPQINPPSDSARSPFAPRCGVYH